MKALDELLVNMRIAAREIGCFVALSEVLLDW
jgi:hypothetical protein